MALVTDEQITAAADQAAAAVAELEAMRAQRRAQRGPVSPDTATELARLHLQAEEAEDRVELLRSTQAEQRTQLEARAARERAAAPALAAMSKALEAALAGVVEPVVAGRAVDAVAAVGRRNALIGRTREQLLGLALRLDDVDSDIEHATGAGEAGVRLFGRWSATVEPSHLMAWMQHRDARAAFGVFHDYTKWLRRLPGVAEMERRTDGLLAGVPVPPSPVDSRRWVDRPPRWPVQERATAGLDRGPFLSHAQRDRMAQPTPDPDWRERFKEEFGRYPDDAA